MAKKAGQKFLSTMCRAAECPAYPVSWCVDKGSRRDTFGVRQIQAECRVAQGPCLLKVCFKNLSWGRALERGGVEGGANGVAPADRVTEEVR